MPRSIGKKSIVSVSTDSDSKLQNLSVLSTKFISQQYFVSLISQPHSHVAITVGPVLPPDTFLVTVGYCTGN